MKKGRNTAFLAFALVLVLMLAACGSGGGSGAGGQTSASPGVYDEADYERNDYGAGFYPREEPASEDGGAGETALPEERKIIRNASLEIMAQDASGLYRSIVNYGTGLGGYEYSYSISNYEAFSVINAVFKVPPEKLSSFVNFIGENGNVVNSNMHSEDITDSYFDAQTRLETKRKSLEQYYALLMNASNVEQIVTIQRVIDGITEDIESLEGRLKVWNSQVSMSTVSMYIRQDNDPLQIRKEISWNTLSADDMGYLMKRGFFAITNTLMSVLQWLVVILIGYSPLWIIIAAGVFVGLKLRKKRRLNRATLSEKRKNGNE